jgi:hypothetical protein
MPHTGGMNPRLAIVLGGANLRFCATPVAEPSNIETVRHPRIVKTGDLKYPLDGLLLRDLVRRHSDRSFVVVGPRTLDRRTELSMEEITHISNLHFPGPKTFIKVAAYPQHSDACIMPYPVIGGRTTSIP